MFNSHTAHFMMSQSMKVTSNLSNFGLCDNDSKHQYPEKKIQKTSTVGENHLSGSKWLLCLQSVSEVGRGWYLALDLLDR